MARLDWASNIRSSSPPCRCSVPDTVYGGDMAYYRAQSPWFITEQNAEKLCSGLIIRQIIGD